MTLALAIVGWGFCGFLLVKLWIEMNMRMELEEEIRKVFIETKHAQAMRDSYKQECI